ncbi:MAG: hypothetical protein ACI8ZO_001772 [Flavobacteriales bacterium]|jgi:hypothetical protein
MPKQKNTNNKKKHTKLLDQKTSKKREEKELRAKALKELVTKMNKAESSD